MAEIERRSTKAFFGLDERLDAAPDPVAPPGDGWRMEGSGVCWVDREHVFVVVWHWVRELGCGAPVEERRTK